MGITNILPVSGICSDDDLSKVRKFSEIIETLPVAKHFENLTIHHKLYEEIAHGTLPIVKFQVFTQQDNLYVTNYFRCLRKLSDREDDPDRKKFLQEVGSAETVEQGFDEYFQGFYDKFNFKKAVKLLPNILDYSAAQYNAANFEHIGIALATLYPCYTVWAKMGTHLKEIGNLGADNPYIDFINVVSSLPMESKLVKDFINSTNDYYDRMGIILRRKMLNVYVRSVELEYAFVSTCYSATSIEPVIPPKFTDLVETLGPKIQDQIIHHPLFEELAYGTLPLHKYRTLMQQDLLYLRSYYKAYSCMEAKEKDNDRKEVLLKDPNTWMEQFFQNQFKTYEFGPAAYAGPYTAGYIQLTLDAGERGTILEGMAITYPAKILWIKVAQQMARIVNLNENPNHPYKEFVQLLVERGNNHPTLSPTEDLINEYYEEAHERGDFGLQHRAIELARKGILNELQFITGVYGIDSGYADKIYPQNLS